MVTRRLGLTAAVFLCVLVGGLVLGGASAFALHTHVFASSFGGPGAGDGQFSEPSGVAVNAATHDVYVVDVGNNRVERFSSAGVYVSQFDGAAAPTGAFSAPSAIAVDNSGSPLDPSVGAVYVVDTGHNVVDKFSAAGVYEGQLAETTGGAVFGALDGVAVDASGVVWVYQASGEIDSFSDALSNEYLSARPSPFETSPGFAVDSEDDLYVNRGITLFTKLNSTGEVLIEGIGDEASTAAGVNQSTDEVFIDNRTSIRAYDSSGSLVQHFGSGHLENGSGTAVDPATGTVYVADATANTVAVFDERLLADVTTGVASDVAVGSVTLNGTVNPDGVQVSDCHFEYGTTSAYGQSVPCVPAAGSIPADSNQHAVSADIAGLAAGAVYHFRLVSANANGSNEGQDVIFGPPRIDGTSASPVGQTIATLQAQVNPDAVDTTYRFEYGTTSAYGISSPVPDGDLGAASSDQAASTELAGLLVGTTYHYRVVATNSAGTVPGPDETFTTVTAALIDGESVSQVTSNSATLAAQINPLGRGTTYHFEYGPTAGYGTSLPIPDGDAGSGSVDVALSAPVGGLAPGTVYHYRLVTTNALGSVQGTDHAFTTQSGEASGLLDGRGWEMVSAPDKHGAALEALSPTFGGLIQASRGGGAVAYLATGPAGSDPAGNRSGAYTQVLSTRGSGGWVSRSIATPNETPSFSISGLNAEYRLFSGDLSVGLVDQAPATTGAPRATLLSPAATEQTPYRREVGGEFTPLVTAGNVPSGTKFGGEVSFEGASADLSHVVLGSFQALAPGFSNGRQSLYEWSGGSLLPVSVLPDGQPVTVAGLGLESNVRGAVSDDGSRIVWNAESAGVNHLYLRDMRLGGSVQLDVLEAGAQGGTGVPVFQIASSDGSKVFFTDISRLTKDATSAEPNEPDLYMCEVGEAAGKPTCTLKDLSVDQNVGEAANVHAYRDGDLVLGAGRDGRYVYFVASGVLASGAVSGQPNLYVYDTVLSARRLVATLSGEDTSDWASGSGSSPDLLTVRVSSSGRYLAFMSLRSLTGYDNIDANSGQPDTEVFLFDADSGRVVCASCNPSGARPTGVFDTSATFPGLLVDRLQASEWGGHWLAGSIPAWENQSEDRRGSWYQPDYLSDSGRLFFNAADALVRGDTNGREDVYEFEPEGVDGCQGASVGVSVAFGVDAGGCVGLISSGSSGEESALLDASESGDDVFFLTASRLAPQDIDDALDVYDAHVCSGSSPCLAGSVAAPPVACTSGDSCRGPGGVQPEVFGAPSSSTVSGAGNLTAPGGTPTVKAKKSVSRAQKLKAALRVCHRKRGHRQRVSCEARARRLYGKGATAKNAVRAGATSKGNR